MAEQNQKRGIEGIVRGFVEDAKGTAKEVIGTVTRRDNLVREGKAQQDKGRAQRDAARQEAQAQSARGGARAAEARQKQNR